MGSAFESVIGAAQAVSTAIEMIKAASAAGDALDRADLKFKLADALNALADAKISVAAARQDLQQAYSEIDELAAKLRLKAEVVRVYDAYYERDADGAGKGDPFCLRCWEVDHTLIHLIRGDRSEPSNVCPACRQKYGKRVTRFASEASVRE